MHNEVEWLTLLQGLEMVDWGTISSLLFFGDSRHVILNMRTSYSAGSINYRKYYDRISHLPLPPSTSYYHILRANNVRAENLANKGASLPQGSISFNSIDVVFKPIP